MPEPASVYFGPHAAIIDTCATRKLGDKEVKEAKLCFGEIENDVILDGYVMPRRPFVYITDLSQTDLNHFFYRKIDDQTHQTQAMLSWDGGLLLRRKNGNDCRLTREEYKTLRQHF